MSTNYKTVDVPGTMTDNIVISNDVPSMPPIRIPMKKKLTCRAIPEEKAKYMTMYYVEKK